MVCRYRGFDSLALLTMDVEKVKELIKQKMKDTDDEYKRQCSLYERDNMFAKPDYAWRDTRINAFKEALELVGMLNQIHNK